MHTHTHTHLCGHCDGLCDCWPKTVPTSKSSTAIVESMQEHAISISMCKTVSEWAVEDNADTTSSVYMYCTKNKVLHSTTKVANIHGHLRVL